MDPWPTHADQVTTNAGKPSERNLSQNKSLEMTLTSLLLDQRTPTVIISRLFRSMGRRDMRVPPRSSGLVSSCDPACEVQNFGGVSHLVRFRYLGRLHRKIRWFGRLPRSRASQYPTIGRSSR